MNSLRATARNWPLSAKLVAALAIAMLPMGVLAVVIATQNFADISTKQPSLPQLLSMSLPILMWLAALLTGWFAIHHMVVRPLAAIQRLMRDYGHSADPERTKLRFGSLDHGSNELAALAACFDDMADEIDQHSRDLRTALVEQRRLTREVHHRVKNNLQIVSSLLSLQARDADSPELVQTYAVIQARITALAQVHRWMYDDVSSLGVDLRSLITDLCLGLEISLASPERGRVTVECKADPVEIHPDGAVPVAFLVTELASLAALHAPPGPLDIIVSASRNDEAVSIAVTARGFEAIDRIAADSTAPTARIIHGMARQLRSSLVHDPVKGSYSVSFAPLAG